LFRPLGRSEPSRGACGAGRHLRTRSILDERSRGSRRRFRRRVPRVLAVVASARLPGAARKSLSHRDGDLRRPLTSCAHRLGKPHRTCEPLAPSVTQQLRGSDSTRCPERPARLASRSGPCSVRLRRRRRRFRTTASAESGRLPSDRPPPCGGSRLGRARSYTRAASPRTLSLAAIRPSPVKGAAGRLKLSPFALARLAARPSTFSR